MNGNETLDRIQQEIKESLQREEELRKEYARANSYEQPQQNGTAAVVVQQNGFSSPAKSPSPVPPLTNGSSKTNINGHVNGTTGGVPGPAAPTPQTNGFRRFAPNPSSKGVMQKFLKMRGKVGMITIKPASSTSNGISTPQQPAPHQNNPQTTWRDSDGSFEPAKVTVEAGKTIRKGFIPAEEKMRRELLEFQRREAELRKERRKSQPDLMAALEAETEPETNLKKPTRSMVQMYNSSEDLVDDVFATASSSSPASLKPARSLADLCDAFDDELETPGTHSLILQFENMKAHQ